MPYDGRVSLGGTHLLDETGKYNIAHVQYLPNADIRLVTLAYRLQGFIVRRAIRTYRVLPISQDPMFRL